MTTPWGIILSVEARDLRFSNFFKAKQSGNAAWGVSLCCDKSIVLQFQIYPSILCFVTLQKNWHFCFFRGILKIGGTSRKACCYCWHHPTSGFLPQQWCLVPAVSLILSAWDLFHRSQSYCSTGSLSRLLGSITPTSSLCPSAPGVVVSSCKYYLYYLSIPPLLLQSSSTLC